MTQPKIEIIVARDGKYIASRVIYNYLSRIAGRKINKRRGSKLLETVGIVSELGRSTIYRGEHGNVVIHYKNHPLLGHFQDRLVYIPK